MNKKKTSKLIDQYNKYLSDEKHNTNDWERKNDHLMKMLYDACDDEPKKNTGKCKIVFVFTIASSLIYWLFFI